MWTLIWVNESASLRERKKMPLSSVDVHQHTHLHKHKHVLSHTHTQIYTITCNIYIHRKHRRVPLYTHTHTSMDMYTHKHRQIDTHTHSSGRLANHPSSFHLWGPGSSQVLSLWQPRVDLSLELARQGARFLSPTLCSYLAPEHMEWTSKSRTTRRLHLLVITPSTQPGGLGALHDPWRVT